VLADLSDMLTAGGGASSSIADLAGGGRLVAVTVRE
jgi:hypothetical protein